MNDEEKKVLELLRMANELMGCILDDKQANIILNLIEKLQKENKESKELYNKLLTGYNKLVQEYLELEKENQRQAELLSNIHNKYQKEKEELKKDISNMYDKEVVISVMCNNFDITRIETLEMLGEEE